MLCEIWISLHAINAAFFHATTCLLEVLLEEIQNPKSLVSFAKYLQLVFIQMRMWEFEAYSIRLFDRWVGIQKKR